MADFLTINPPSKLKGAIKVPGDKSVSHRAVLIGSLAEGETNVENFLRSADCISTINCMRGLGVEINEKETSINIKGRGLNLKPPQHPLDAGNSGTTARLILGVLAGQPFRSELTGDDSLTRRPMLRVVHPLREMGAKIAGKQDGDQLPLIIEGGELTPIEYDLPVPSAQVKSAILLAGLFAEGRTQVREFCPTRDHTERMLKSFGVEMDEEDELVKTVQSPVRLKGSNLQVPGDISSAAFFMVASAIVPGSEVALEKVGINPTRTGIIEALRQMGASIEIENLDYLGEEPVADIRVTGNNVLRGITLEGSIIPRIIDEIPALAVAALVAKGTTEIKDAEELRVKESDRIETLTQELSRLGARIEPQPDGLLIEGYHPLFGADCESHGDHRLAMALSIAALIASGETRINSVSSAEISYPRFIDDLCSLIINEGS